MTDINTVERMTVSKLKNKQTKKNTHLAANPTTAENQLKEKERGEGSANTKLLMFQDPKRNR